MHPALPALGRSAASRPQDFDTGVDEVVAGVVRSVGAEMRRQPASMVYEIIRESLERRLPGIDVDQEPLREAAARIAAGVPV
jgi:hypothetical protein